MPRKRSGSGELLIRPYFEPDTFRHVLTIYSLVMRPTLKQTDEIHKTAEERFGDFKVVDEIILPYQWEIRYRKDPVAPPQEFQWRVKLTRVVHGTIGQ